MKKFLKWLGRYLVRDKSRDNRGRPSSRARASSSRPPDVPTAGAKPVALPAHPPKPAVTAESGGSIEDGGPGKNVFIRGRQVGKDTDTQDLLKIIDEPTGNAQNDGAFDPYNTGRFDRSNSWKNRGRN